MFTLNRLKGQVRKKIDEIIWVLFIWKLSILYSNDPDPNNIQPYALEFLVLTKLFLKSLSPDRDLSTISSTFRTNIGVDPDSKI